MTVQMKAGEYYIGDCCYVLAEEYLDNFDWSIDFCDQFFEDPENIVIQGKQVVAFGTMHGDGVYESNIDFEFPVDAGLIGCTPKELWKGPCEPFGCKLVHFHEDFVCGEHNGTVVFGHVVIETDFDDEYD
jgi:hypothetical protein